MAEHNPDIPPSPEEDRQFGCESAAHLVFGVVIGFIGVTVPMPFIMVLTQNPLNNWILPASIYLLITAVCIQQFVHLAKHRGKRHNAFRLGILIGACLAALIEGICFSVSGPLRPG